LACGLLRLHFTSSLWLQERWYKPLRALNTHIFETSDRHEIDCTVQGMHEITMCCQLGAPPCGGEAYHSCCQDLWCDWVPASSSSNSTRAMLVVAAAAAHSFQERDGVTSSAQSSQPPCRYRYSRQWRHRLCQELEVPSASRHHLARTAATCQLILQLLASATESAQSRAQHWPAHPLSQSQCLCSTAKGEQRRPLFAPSGSCDALVGHHAVAYLTLAQL
jgi:hypothetical protein